MIKNIYNSSGKIIGNCEFSSDCIIVNNTKKPQLVIKDAAVLSSSLSRNVDVDVVKYLYDDLTLTIGEIACIFDVHYHQANRWIKSIEVKTSQHSGRRNASCGAVFTKSRCSNISSGIKRYYSNGGVYHGYERTKEIREKVSNGLKEYFKDNPQDGIAQRNAWANGKYSNTNFKRGIGGYFTSPKIHKRFFFRSLLELYYLVNYLEENDDVETYDYEPGGITCDNGTIYIPDFIVNKNTVVEIKSYKFVYAQGGEIQRKFEYKCEQAKKYCDERGLTFKVVFDKDIDFKYDVLKHQLKEGKYIQKYNIEFLQPERVWSRK